MARSISAPSDSYSSPANSISQSRLQAFPKMTISEYATTSSSPCHFKPSSRRSASDRCQSRHFAAQISENSMFSGTLNKSRALQAMMIYSTNTIVRSAVRRGPLVNRTHKESLVQKNIVPHARLFLSEK